MYIYQLKIWCSSHISTSELDDPSKYGWTFEKGYWEPVFATQDPIPNSVRDALLIYCSDKNCNTNKCTCLKEGLRCSIECKCNNCNNACVNDIEEDDEHDLDDMSDI